ncbi:MAG: ATP-grasp domain-containing protein [Calothrix sp. MO_167.B12]|nr:ATP-grasp domain-containing protein [Calothrix sp. MO_167.B12]
MTSQHQKSNSSHLPTILLVTTGYHLYREYLLKMVAEHSNIWLFLDSPPDWQIPYILGYTVVDTLDAQMMIDAARNLPEDVKIDGVLCWDEIRMVQTAKLTQALGLPGTNPEYVARCRDKHLTRRFLTASRVPQPTSILVSSLDEATQAAEIIGYPVIIKPRALGASYGVSLVNGAEEVNTAFEHAKTATEDGVPVYDQRVLVEEYMQGPEVSIDIAWVNGVMYPMFVARKITGFFPYFEEIGHIVHSHDPLLEDSQFLSVLQQAHQAVGFFNGITHTELRLTQSGAKIVEINARLGGDMIPYVGWFASGINPGQVAVAVACGHKPNIEKTHKSVAAIHFLYPEYDAIVDSVHINHAELPASVDVAASLVTPGQKLLLPPADHVSCRYAYLIVHRDTAEDCTETIELAVQTVTLKTRHLSTVGVLS